MKKLANSNYQILASVMNRGLMRMDSNGYTTNEEKRLIGLEIFMGLRLRDWIYLS